MNGDVDALTGELGGVKLDVCAIKEAYYVMMIITTYVTLSIVGEKNKRIYYEKGPKRQNKFHYKEVLLFYT